MSARREPSPARDPTCAPPTSSLPNADLQVVRFLRPASPSRTEMRELDASVDDLRRRYGNKCVVWGAQLVDEGAASVDAKADNTVHPVSFFHS